MVKVSEEVTTGKKVKINEVSRKRMEVEGITPRYLRRLLRDKGVWFHFKMENQGGSERFIAIAEYKKESYKMAGYVVEWYIRNMTSWYETRTGKYKDYYKKLYDTYDGNYGSMYQQAEKVLINKVTEDILKLNDKQIYYMELIVEVGREQVEMVYPETKGQFIKDLIG